MFKTPSPHRMVKSPSLTSILRESDSNDHSGQKELDNVFTESEDAVLLDAFAQAPIIARSIALAPWKPDSLPFGIANRLANLAVAQQKARGMTWRHPLKTTRRRLIWLARHQLLSPTGGTVLFGPFTATPERSLSSPGKSPTRLSRASSNPFIDQHLKKTKLTSNSMIMKKLISPRRSRLGIRSASSSLKQTKDIGSEGNLVLISGESDVSSPSPKAPTILARSLFQDSLVGNTLVRTGSDNSIVGMRSCNDMTADSLFVNMNDENYEPDSPYSDIMMDFTEEIALGNQTSSSIATSVTSPTTPISPLAQKSDAAQLLHLNRLNLENHQDRIIITHDKNGDTDITSGNKKQKMLRAGSLTHSMDEGLDEVAYVQNDQVIGDEYY